MKFIVGQSAQHSGVFLVEGETARPLPGAGPDLSALAAGANMPAPEGAAIAISAISPMLPVARPGKIICLGLNYIDHIKEGGYDVPTYPALFMRGLNSMVPSGSPMIRPSCSDNFDYEVELMVIMGRSSGRHIAEEDALDAVFGYTVFNDGSLRDYQYKTHQWTPGKNFDATGGIGPIVVTPDELPAGADGLKIECRVAGETLQSATTSDMLWSTARTITAISEFATLEPGDMIALGTPPGVGKARKPPRWLRPGETVEAEIEGIGICTNPIVAEEDRAATEAAE